MTLRRRRPTLVKLLARGELRGEGAETSRWSGGATEAARHVLGSAYEEQLRLHENIILRDPIPDSLLARLFRRRFLRQLKRELYRYDYVLTAHQGNRLHITHDKHY